MGKSGYLGDFKDYLSFYGINRDEISDNIKSKLEDDVQDVLQTCMTEVRSFLQEHKDLLEYFAQELIKKGELEYDEIREIFAKFGLTPASEQVSGA